MNEPKWLTELRHKALSLIEKAPSPKYGAKINLLEFNKSSHLYSKVSRIEDLPNSVQEALERTALTKVDSYGITVHVDASTVYKLLRLPRKVTVMSMEDALLDYPELKKYWFGVFPMALNKLTLFHAAYSRGGVFIRIPENTKVDKPIQSCFIVSSSKYAQLPHNIIIAEENSEAHILTGCTAPRNVRHALHAGLTEVYVKKGAKVTLTTIEIWPYDMHVRPLAGVRVEEGGEFIENYILLKPPKTLQAYPTALLVGEKSSCLMRSIIVGLRESDVDVGSASYLMGSESSAKLVSRAVAFHESKVVQRTKLWSKAPLTRGYVDCRGLIVGEKASLSTYPSLIADHKESNLVHESAIGRIAEDELFYLMSRGLNEEEAIGLLIRGFLDPGIMDLPPEISREIEKVIQITAEQAL
ncbi:MAG: hypothetical protein DRJ52_02680 [Thermoprotei archaeon]|nr:MAG: hypothetical protein DRJ52_02680 [Thermoprotei archaeon]RLE99882.1 MAG: hypothetical protein DRJ63_04095 [Thermoprotei archaeon]HDI74688.1 SufD family Fe-S cluster assembly protein [Thermoprotei archaeon]